MSNIISGHGAITRDFKRQPNSIAISSYPSAPERPARPQTEPPFFRPTNFRVKRPNRSPPKLVLLIAYSSTHTPNERRKFDRDKRPKKKTKKQQPLKNIKNRRKQPQKKQPLTRYRKTLFHWCYANACIGRR